MHTTLTFYISSDYDAGFFRPPDQGHQLFLLMTLMCSYTLPPVLSYYVAIPSEVSIVIAYEISMVISPTTPFSIIIRISPLTTSKLTEFISASYNAVGDHIPSPRFQIIN